MARCLLCFNITDENDCISLEDRLENEENSTVADIIRLHFEFIEKTVQNQNDPICNNCWLAIDTFHDFYSMVVFNYENRENSLIEQVEIEEDEDEEKIIEDPEDESLKREDLSEFIVYDYDNVKDTEQELYEKQIVKMEEVSIDSQNDYQIEEVNMESIESEWITEDPDGDDERTKKKSKIIAQQFILDTADDQRIKETAKMFCDLCSLPVDSLREAKAHFKYVHNREGYLICCDRKFKQRCRLVEHVNTHYHVTYPCEICGKSFDSKSYLSKHLACHETIREYKCDMCHKDFAKKFQVRNHLLSVHVYENVEPLLECPLENCFKKFVNQARLKHHIDYTHNNQEMEICEICTRQFKSKNAVEEHKKIHTKRPEDRIKCEICGHYLGDLKSFKRHVKNHETENFENVCNICGKRSPNANALRKHVRYVHEMKKNYSCRYCDKSFKRPRNLMDHEASVHTLQDLYTCTFCPKKFRNQSNMLSHRKKQHPDEYQKPSYMREQL